ncbi:NAD(P)H-dependent oxidoreductase (plasmid) [Arthrobacter sp. TMP15]|uniref:flavodoxin family protein n=1 Tax=Arthrobacter sp. TMP15 TaxID=3140789 RepID=UPI0031BBC6C2
MSDDQLRAIALVCTLSPSPAPSSSQLLAEQVMEALSEHGVIGSVIRVVDHDVHPGVELDMGDGDAWPNIREQVMSADILVLATPTWMGQHSSVAQRVLERLDAELSEKDEQGRMLTLGKVAIAVIVGNEDGAHHISGILFQALNDVGFTLAGQTTTYWNDAVGSDYRDYQDLEETPEAVASTNRTAAAHAAHLARLLRQNPYPAVS